MVDRWSRFGLVAALLTMSGLGACGPADEAATDPERRAWKVMREMCARDGKDVIIDQIEGKHRCVPEEPAGDPRP